MNAHAESMDQETIETLLSRIHQGDEHALASLYDQYANAVFSVAFQVLDHHQDAEEITQDVFMRIWHKSEHFDPDKGQFLTWLLTMTRRAAIDALRRRGRASQVPNPVSLDEHHYLWEKLDGREDISDLQRTLLSTLQELPQESREAIQLAYFRGMTHVEVAEHLNRPLGTVKSHIRQGMEKLRLIWKSGESESGSKKSS